MGRSTTAALGRRAEQSAFNYLIEHGLVPVARNFRRRGGEIDLIMLHDDCLVFVEVRYRTSSSFTQPGHTVDRRKQRKIIRTAAMFIARNHRYSLSTTRFDVVAVEGLDDTSIDWIPDAFRPNDGTL